MGRVDGKVAFITGAARGMGRAHAVRLAEEGADVIALDICAEIDSTAYPLATEEDLAETIGRVEACGRRAVPIVADVRDAEAMAAGLADAVGRLGKLDIVVANAGIASYAPMADLPLQSFQDVIDVNLGGVWKTCWASLGHIGDGGSIILIGSTLSVKGPPLAGHYTAAKHGVVGITRSLASELAPRMIRVNAILPTTVPTELLLNEGTYRVFRPDLEQPTLEDAKDIMQQLNILPVPWIEPEEIANGVLFLASDEARYITSAVLPVDAGTAAK
jgi:SDR family mycofactocin-dependent oxidoreductase